MQLHKLACSYMSLLQFPELACSSYFCLSSSQEFRNRQFSQRCFYIILDFLGSNESKTAPTCSNSCFQTGVIGLWTLTSVFSGTPWRKTLILELPWFTNNQRQSMCRIHVQTHPVCTGWRLMIDQKYFLTVTQFWAQTIFYAYGGLTRCGPFDKI